MRRNLYYELFRYLYDHYDISGGTALDKFAKSKIRPQQELVDILHIKNMLNELENRGIITWKADKITTNQDGVTSYHWLDIQRYKKDLGKDANHTFENTRVEAHLTPDEGLEYAANIINTLTGISINKWIKGLTIGLLFVAVVTAFLQFLQYRESAKQTRDQVQKDSSDKPVAFDNDTSTKTVEKKEIVLIAMREAAFGGIRLNLYSDKTFDLGTLTKIKWAGTYSTKGDTLFIFTADSLVTSFLTKDSTLLEVKNKWTRINFLEIQENRMR